MKKLIAVFAVLLMAVPAMGADWSFYGSARMATFYVSDDFGDFESSSGGDDDWGMVWDFQGNSRLGARVKADKVSGHIELGLKGTDGGDVDVGTRRAYALWKFADNASLKVGKDYSPVTRFISGQVFGTDDGLLGSGNFYGRRPGQIGLNLGNLEIAAITNATGAVRNVPVGSPPGSTDTDWNIPKLEASYKLTLGGFDLRPFGGFQYYRLSDGTSGLSDDLDVISYVVGIDSMINIGAFWVGGQFAYGQNWSNANWASSRLSNSASSTASVDGTDDTNDATSWTGMLVAGLKFTDTLKFEAGAGYRNDDPDTPGSDEDECWQVYGQAVMTLAPGVYLIPEVGYADKMDNAAGDDEGTQWYAGAKWQIDF